MARFFQCDKTKEIVYLLGTEGHAPECCGTTMRELTANTTDAATEKHVPVVEMDGNKVKVTVGSVLHPMTEAHLIQWVFLETKNGGELRMLTPQDEPVAEFVLAEGDKALAAYEYCNLHGLWKKEL